MTTGFFEPRILRIELPPGMPLLNANDRIHHKERSKRTERLRSEAFRRATFPEIPGDPPRMTFSRVKIKATFRGFSSHKRDSSNLFPTVKVVVDQLVKAKVIPYDDDRCVKSVEILRGGNLTGNPAKDGGGQLIVEVIECE